MPGIPEQIQEIVRTIINLGRRVRRLETLQVPISLARPTGGHIIQDEGIPLTDQVYLNFVGARVAASDDPDNGATIITVSDPEGDDFCRVVPLDVGWQISAGTTTRFLKHSTGFQLDSDGDARGAYAIDLQQDRSSPSEIAGGDYSGILGGLDNEIHPDSNNCFILGIYNYIQTLGGWEPLTCFILGSSNLIRGDCYGLSILGVGHDVDHANYGMYQGANQQTDGAFGCVVFIEANDLNLAGNDVPTYCGIMGIQNLMEGDIFGCFQFGEDNEMINAGGATQLNWTSFQFGYDNHQTNVQHNFAFGRNTSSYLPTDLDYFAGRCLYNGDAQQDFPSGVEYYGFNQSSRFDQNMKITNWTVAWQTGRFEFPIISDSIWYFRAFIAGTEQGCANSYAWKIEGVVENDGGTTTILTSTVTNVFRDVATKEWQVIADDPNDRLVFQYRDTAGPDGTDCNIQFSMQTTEVGMD